MQESLSGIRSLHDIYKHSLCSSILLLGLPSCGSACLNPYMMKFFFAFYLWKQWFQIECLCVLIKRKELLHFFLIMKQLPFSMISLGRFSLSRFTNSSVFSIHISYLALGLKVRKFSFPLSFRLFWYPFVCCSLHLLD